jgi:hypothetical protein
MKNSTRTIILTALVAFAAGMWTPQLRVRQVSAQEPPILNGIYGYQATQPISASNPTLSSAIGTMTFDGLGKVFVSQTMVETDGAPNATSLRVNRAQIAGTYIINLDGTGSLSFDVGGDRPVTFAFVMTDRGANILLTGTGGGNILTIGSLRKL